ncbi:Uncharacterised protein [Neisseria animaloris]|nr:Uncharacterised protein [Neisseria animaloris]
MCVSGINECYEYYNENLFASRRAVILFTVYNIGYLKSASSDFFRRP